MIIAAIVVGVILLIVVSIIVGMTWKSPMPVRIRVSSIGMLVCAALMCIRLGIDIYLGLSWTKSAGFVAMFIASSALVWFAGKKKIEQQSKNEH